MHHNAGHDVAFFGPLDDTLQCMVVALVQAAVTIEWAILHIDQPSRVTAPLAVFSDKSFGLDRPQPGEWPNFPGWLRQR